MVFYFLYIIISSFIILLVSSNKIEIRTYNWYLIFLLSFLFSGLRYQIGTDYLNYKYVFDDLRRDDIALLEYGNYLLMYLVQLIDGPFQLYILVTSFIICYSFFKFIKLFSRDKSISFYFPFFWIILFIITELYTAIFSYFIFYFSIMFYFRKQKNKNNIFYYFLNTFSHQCSSNITNIFIL